MPETSATTDGKPDATDDQRKKYEVLLPLYVQHLKELEARCLREGRALLPHEVGWAQECKIQVPDRVRILSLPAIPAPVNDKVRQAEIEFERLTGRPCGAEVAALCVGYGILIRYEYALNPDEPEIRQSPADSAQTG